MPTNLTGSQIKDTYEQLLHVDGGPAGSEKVVYGGAGTATALKLGTGSASVDNLRLDGNTLSSTNTNGDINLTPNGSGSVVASNVDITGGSITGITDLAVADGGTGASNASGARTNLGIGTMGTQAASAVAITGGAIDGATVGSTTPAAVKGTTVQATTSLGFATGLGSTVTQITSKATGVTLNAPSGKITMDSATLNRVTGVTFTLTNSYIAVTDVVIVNIASGATANAYTVGVDAIAAGSCNIHLHNHLAAVDLSEAVILNFVVIKGAHS